MVLLQLGAPVKNVTITGKTSTTHSTVLGCLFMGGEPEKKNSV